VFEHPSLDENQNYQPVMDVFDLKAKKARYHCAINSNRSFRKGKTNLSPSCQWLTERQTDLIIEDRQRDWDLWRHLFFPEDRVFADGRHERVSDMTMPPRWCCGDDCGDGDGVVGYYWIPSELMYCPAIRQDRRSRRDVCEAEIERLRRAGESILLIVTDGADGLDCWVDACGSSLSEEAFTQMRARCPGGVNPVTGEVHRVIWADPAIRIPWADDLG
jgi:hypothetical protein